MRHIAKILALAICFTVLFVTIFDFDAPKGPTLSPTRLQRDNSELSSSSQKTEKRLPKREFIAHQLYNLDDAKSWLEFMDSFDDDELPPLTKETQRWIWEKQHPDPATCKDLRYFTAGTHISGFGSSLHVAGWDLSNALEFGYIFVWNKDHQGAGALYADDGCGRGEDFTNFECFFERMSSCSYRDATDKNSVTHREQMERPPGTIVRLPHQPPTYLIKLLQERLSPAILNEHFIKFWWRAQAAAYMLRLNKETSRAVMKLRLDQALHSGVYTGASSNVNVKVPFPLPYPTVSIHVRHGDKASEMELQPFKKYIDDLDWFLAENPFGYQRQFFVSSEDDAVITEAKSLGNYTKIQSERTHGWTVFSSNIDRVNGSPFQQLSQFGKTKMTHQWILQLFMAIECDAFVGTRGSNWNRLIEELKSMYGKAKAPYIESGKPDDSWGFQW